MKGSNSPVLRAIYIVLVPVVLLIILLNTGWLQRHFPAATVNGTSYTTVQYNYYYYENYYAFLEEHADELDELGYDQKTRAARQQYDDDTTWQEYFQGLAEADMAQTAYYYDLAQEAGYVFSQEELLPIQQRLEEQTATRTLYGLTASNYYVSYFGSGMTEELYTQELTRTVKAQAYKTYLAQAYTPDQAELEAWMADHPEEEYTALSVQVITLDAQPDRATGEVGQAQLEALEQQLERLAQRYEQGVSFDTLQAQFSTCALGDLHGALVVTRGADLPQPLVAHYIDAQSDADADLTAPFSCVDEETGTAYFVHYVATAGSGPVQDADDALSAQAVQAQEELALADVYTVTQNWLGMSLAAS